MSATTHQLVVTGMTCAGCAGRVERALAAAPGVEAAHVNLANTVATVRGDDLALTSLIDVVRKTGYSATPRDIAPPRRPMDEAAALGRNFWIAFALTLPVFLVEMGGHFYPPLHHWIHQTIGMQLAWQIQFVVIGVVLLWPGRMFFRIGLPNLARGTPEMNALVAMGTGAAFLYSSVTTFFPHWLPEEARHVYFESAGVIVTLILLGRYLEARAKARALDAVAGLKGLQPDMVLVEIDGTPEPRPLDSLMVGDILHSRAGERIAVDGVILSGSSHIDESMLSGEPLPVAKTEGDALTAGTINGPGLLRYRATAVGADTALAQILTMVEDAQGMKLPVQALADRVIRIFVPAVILIALAAVGLWLAVGQSLSFALVIGVSILIIACPCALGLAVPVSVMVGTGRAVSQGVLFRQGDAVQRLEGLKAVAFDKTGTLTEGRFAISSVTVAEGFAKQKVLNLAAAAEAGSDHPIAQAIAAKGNGLSADEAKVIPGKGAAALVEGREVLIGTAAFLQESGIDSAELTAPDDGTVVYVAINGSAAGVIGLSDQIKPSAKSTIGALQNAGLTVAMISGDRAEAAQAIAAKLGITEVTAGVLPEGKTKALAALRGRYGPIAFVGDGINDAPALAQADVGMAIGSGTDIALDSADIVLSASDPEGVLSAMEISRAVMRNIRQNLFWAFGYNILLIPIAAGILYPLAGTLLSPMLAAGAMALSSVFVVTNALRLRR